MNPSQQVEIRYVPVLATYLDEQHRLVSALLARVHELEQERDAAREEAHKSRELVKDTINGQVVSLDKQRVAKS